MNKIIYNVTINIEDDIQQEWLAWMKGEHIPEVMKTGCFLENKICRVLVNEESGTTYSVQYTCNSMEEYKKYLLNHSINLQQNHTDRYAGKFVAFRTLLEVI